MTNSGGKGANQAVACAKLGGEVYMIGAVGNDSFGADCLGTISSYGVDTRFVSRLYTSTGVAVIVVVDGNNRIILDGGANYAINVDSIVKIIRDNLSEGDIFVTQLEISQDVVDAGLKTAKLLGAITVLNPAPARPISRETLRCVDYVLPNETEAKILTGVDVYDDESILRAGAQFHKLGAIHTIITLGSRGCALVDDDKLTLYSSQDVKVVDTTAAGDTFLGALVGLLSKGETLDRAIKIAQVASSITVSRAGAQQSIPTIDEVNALIASKNIKI